MQNIEFHSHEQQDEFIFNLFQKKQNGFFLDIACGNPVIGSNTYTLEKYCGWTGFCFDTMKNSTWSEWRTSPLINMDVTSEDMVDFLISNIPTSKVIDYISLDVDADGVNLSSLALKRILQSNVKFKAMTLEHESHLHGEYVQNRTVHLLEERGFVPLFKNVHLWSGGVDDDSNAQFEDWWIHPDYFSKSILQMQEDGLYYFQCIEKLKQTLKNQYKASHNCSRAWPEEYRLFWNEEEMNFQKEFFRKMTKDRNASI